MTYVLQKGEYYCYIDDKKAICKTADINLSTRFPSKEKALRQLQKASKKLKGFQIMELATNENGEDVIKVKRKSFSSVQRTAIYNKNKGRCAICGDFVPYGNFTIDHIIPLAKGGTNELENLQCACEICNRIKQDILPKDLMDKLNQIILYQMRLNYDDTLWKDISRLVNRRKIKRFKRIIRLIQKELVEEYGKISKR